MRPGVSNRLQGLGMKAARIRAKRSSAQDVPPACRGCEILRGFRNPRRAAIDAGTNRKERSCQGHGSGTASRNG